MYKWCRYWLLEDMKVMMRGKTDVKSPGKQEETLRGYPPILIE